MLGTICKGCNHPKSEGIEQDRIVWGNIHHRNSCHAENRQSPFQGSICHNRRITDSTHSDLAVPVEVWWGTIRPHLFLCRDRRDQASTCISSALNQQQRMEFFERSGPDLAGYVAN